MSPYLLEGEENFLEELRERAETKICQGIGLHILEAYDARMGILATIEALKEMMDDESCLVLIYKEEEGEKDKDSLRGLDRQQA